MSLTYAQRKAAEHGWTRETAAEREVRMQDPMARWLVATAEYGTYLENLADPD